MCLFAAIEYRFIRAEVNNFLIAKGIAVLLIPVITGLIFYSYTAIIGEEILIVDILIFALAVTVGQLVSYKIMMLRKLPGYSRNFGLALIILVGLSLILFTYFASSLANIA